MNTDLTFTRDELEHYFRLQAQAEAYINMLIRQKVAKQIYSSKTNKDHDN